MVWVRMCGACGHLPSSTYGQLDTFQKFNRMHGPLLYYEYLHNSGVLLRFYLKCVVQRN